MNLGEFDRRYFVARGGAVSAVGCALKYLVAPLMLMMVTMDVLERSDGPAEISNILTELRTLVLVFGTSLTVLGFFRGSYPKGSYSRLTFGSTISVLAIAYVYSLLLGGRVERAIADEFFDVDLYLLFTLYFFPAIMTVLMQLGEFMDHRPLWLVRVGKAPALEKEALEGHRFYHDFRPRYGSLFNGLKLARGNLVGFVIIPLAVIILLKAGLSSLDVEQIDAMLTDLDRIAASALYIGLPIAALAFFKGFYPRGSCSRCLPALVMVLLAMYWIWTLGMEGRFVLDSIEDLSISLDYSRLLLLVIAGTGLWSVYYVLELILYRPEWREGGFGKDLHIKEGGRRKERKAKAVATGEGTGPEDPDGQESKER